MTKFLVSGNLNVETSLQIERFPLEYNSVRYPFFGIHTQLSGVAYNVGKGLRTLGSAVQLVSLIGEDLNGRLITRQLADEGYDLTSVRPDLPQSGQSVVIFDAAGRRQIHVDLKDIQEQTFPPAPFEAALSRCDVAVMSTINYNRGLLPLVRASGKPLVSDVQGIGSLDDAYNQDFLAAADLLFMSHENHPGAPEETLDEIFSRFRADVVGFGLGEQGALVGSRSGERIHVPARAPRPIVSTVGAGDSLFASFIHFYFAGLGLQGALERAVLFAGYKIGAASAAEGFLTAAEVEGLLTNDV